MFAYSMREKTHAHRVLKDDIPEEIKQERLSRLIEVMHRFQLEKNQQEIGKIHLVLLDSLGKKANQLKGRTDTNKTVIVESTEHKLGQYVEVQIKTATLKTLFGKILRDATILNH